MLAGDPASDGVLVYLGGVLNVEFGVGGAEFGGRPNSLRCAGVRGMSERSSTGRTRGRSAQMMFNKGSMARETDIQPPYFLISAGTLRVRYVLAYQLKADGNGSLTVDLASTGPRSFALRRWRKEHKDCRQPA